MLLSFLRCCRLSALVVLYGMGLCAGLFVPADAQNDSAALQQNEDALENWVYFSAAQITADDHVIHLQEKAVVIDNERTLSADHILHDRDKKTYDASGSVMLFDADGTHRLADRLFYDSVADRVRFWNATQEAQGTVSTAAYGSSNEDESVYLEKLRYTPCEVCASSESKPLWSVQAQRMRSASREDNLHFYHAFFRIGAIPILYTPYMQLASPALRRKRGLLFPTLRSSSESGTAIGLPYHLPFSDYQDITITPFFYQDGVTMLSADYRHNLVRGHIRAQASAANGKKETDPPNRWWLWADAEKRWNDEWSGQFFFEDVSDADFLFNYNRRIGSTDYFNQAWPLYSVSAAQLRRQNDSLDLRLRLFSVQPSTTLTDLTLPGILPYLTASGTARPPLIGGSLSWQAGLAHFHRPAGLDATQLHATADWERRWIGPAGILVTPFFHTGIRFLSAHGDARQSEYCRPGLAAYPLCKDRLPDPEKDAEAGLAGAAGIELAWPWTAQAGAFDLTITPRLQWRHADRNDVAPLFTDPYGFSLDAERIFAKNWTLPFSRWEKGQRLNAGFSLDAESQQSVRDLSFFAGLSLTTAAENDDSAINLGQPAIDRHAFVLALRTTLAEGFHFTHSYWFDEDGELRDGRSTFDFRFGSLTGNLNYVRLAQLATDESPPGNALKISHQVSTNLNLFAQGPFSVSASGHYDFTANDFISGSVLLDYVNACLRIGVEMRYFNNKALPFNDNLGFYVNLELKTPSSP